MATPATVNNTQLAPHNPTTVVQKMVGDMLQKGTLHLPRDYSAENALKQAWLNLQNVVNLDKKPALSVCTGESVTNALLAMVIQGLNVEKKQGYFIVYGNQLTFQRSYFGDQALAQRVQPGIEFYSGIIYEGDEVEIDRINGRTIVTKHKGAWDNSSKAIKGAYCGVISPTGENLGVTIMTMQEIQKSWQQSKTYKSDGQGTHQKFPAEMALRTVTRKRCKPIINTSNDALLLASIKEQDIEAIEAESDEAVEAHANGSILSLDAPAIVDQATGEVIEEQKQEEALPF